MFSVIKLGGVNGSGKTTVARAIMDITCAQPAKWRGTRKDPNHYVGDYAGTEVLILGSYETTCGGMDTISDKLERLAFVQWAARTAAKRSIIFFEGLITGKTYGAIGEVSDSHVLADKGRWIYAFMDTPFDTCVKRVLKRRAAAGNDAPFDPERTMRPTYNSCVALESKLRGHSQGRKPIPTHHHVHSVNHKHKPEQAAQALLAAAEGLLS